jgi:hypothetical protein
VKEQLKRKESGTDPPGLSEKEQKKHHCCKTKWMNKSSTPKKATIHLVYLLIHQHEYHASTCQAAAAVAPSVE